jgi:transcription elongation factor GreA
MTPTKTIPFTPQKYQEMQDKVVELEQLREEVMKRLITARAMGDLSENGAYKYAKFELGNVKRQLRRFKRLVLYGYAAETKNGAAGVITFGSQVTLENSDESKKQLNFMLVSKHESDPAQNKLSSASPIGSAVMHKKAGQSVVVETPKGETEYLIVRVE